MCGEVQVHGRKGKHLLAPISEAEGRNFLQAGKRAQRQSPMYLRFYFKLTDHLAKAHGLAMPKSGATACRGKDGEKGRQELLVSHVLSLGDKSVCHSKY